MGGRATPEVRTTGGAKIMLEGPLEETEVRQKHKRKTHEIHPSKSHGSSGAKRQSAENHGSCDAQKPPYSTLTATSTSSGIQSARAPEILPFTPKNLSTPAT